MQPPALDNLVRLPPAQIGRDPNPKPTKLDEFKEAGRRYDPASPETQIKFITLCKEIADHIAEVRQNNPGDETHVSTPVFDVIKELIKEEKYMAAQTFLKLIKVRLDADHVQKTNELTPLIPDKPRIEISSTSFDTNDIERTKEIKKFFPEANQITCFSTVHAEKMSEIEELLSQADNLVPAEYKIETQPACLFEAAGYAEIPFEQILVADISGEQDQQSINQLKSLLQKFNAHFENFLARTPAVLPTRKTPTVPLATIPLTTDGRADFHEAQKLLNNPSQITQITLLEIMTHLESAIQMNHELAKTELTGLLKKIMNLRAEGKLPQITSKEWGEICSVIAKKTNDIETLRKLGIAFLNGNKQLGIDKDLNKGRNCLEQLALQTPKGDLESQLIVGEHYLMLPEKSSTTQPQPTRRILFTDRSTASVANKARQFFMLAVEQHDSPDAKSRLKQMADKVDRRDAQRNTVKPRQNLEKPVDKKVDPQVIDYKFMVGMKFLAGNEAFGQAKDPYLAFSYFYEAARHGHVGANFELGKICAEIYQNGIDPDSPTKLPKGLPDNSDAFYQIALDHLNIAFDANHPGTSQAMYDLHALYQKRMPAPSTETVSQQ